MNTEFSDNPKTLNAPTGPGHLKTLIIDIGTKLGFAVLEGTALVTSGTLELASEAELELQRRSGKERTLDLRFTRLCQFIKAKIAEGVTRIVFEDVSFSTTTAQTQLWSSLRAAIWAMAQDSAVEVFCLHANTLKLFATGMGNAEKLDMARALAQAEPDHYRLDGDLLCFQGRTADDNEVDAIWLAKFTIATDNGEQEFLSTYQRDCIRREEKRRKRQEAKAARKARKKAKEMAARTLREQLKEAVKAAGRCCGVFRRLQVGRRAVCPKCGNSIQVRIAPASRPEYVDGQELVS
jgi:Holliday junction resolvasome RuvABC endonuclease subunit